MINGVNEKKRVGTIFYMSPEVLQKNYNEKCDVWALGIMLLQMLTGKRLYDGLTTTKVYEKILKNLQNEGLYIL